MMTYRRGRLFSDYFLSVGIKLLPDYAALDALDVETAQQKLAQKIGALRAMHKPNEAVTETDLIVPVLDVLGWHDRIVQAATNTKRTDIPDYLLFGDATAKATAAALPKPGERFRHGASILEAKAWGVPLDRGGGALGEGVPSSQMLRYLNGVEVQSERRIRFGILSNGHVWRLYDQQATSKAEDFLEVDLLALLGGIVPGVAADLYHPDPAERAHGVRVFLLLFGRDAIAPGVTGRTRIAALLDENRRYEARLTDDLSAVVFGEVFPGLASALAAADPDRPADLHAAYLAELREATLTYLYRLLFVLYAEDRDLLPTRHPGYDDYSLDKRLRGEIARRLDTGDALSDVRTAFDDHLRGLWQQIDKGDSSIGLPPYNGGLFARERAPLLNRAKLADARFAPLFDALSRVKAGTERRRLNYRDLSVQHLGSIYERLLDFDLFANGQGIGVRPQPFARKTSGSYYTPESLVMLVIRRTVGPLLADRQQTFADAAAALASSSVPVAQRLVELAKHDPASRFLDLKICDPAMGSGHFLVSLVDYLADATLAAMAGAPDAVTWGDYVSPLGARLEGIRARIRDLAQANGWSVTDEQLDPRQLVRRMILKRVIYGVDKNPMAVELAKLSLWLHSFTVGAPLSFLDHHLRCGDSLFGEWVRPAMDRLAAGGLLANNAVASAQGAVAGMARVEELTDSDIAEVHESGAQFAATQEATAPLRGMLDALHGYRWVENEAAQARKGLRTAERDARSLEAAKGSEAAASAHAGVLALRRKANTLNTWLEGAFGDPVTASVNFYGKTRDPDPALALLGYAAEVAASERFFHWEVAFPGVWQNWQSAEPEGGFDAIIGNPPWDRVKLQDVEWFAARAPAIARAQRASDRKRMVADLQKAGDPLWQSYRLVAERAEQASRVTRLDVKDGGQYPLLGGGDVNLYSLFVERAHRLVKRDGMVGLIVPSGIAADLGAAPFFKSLSVTGRLAALFDFENRRGDGRAHFFPDVDSRFKFCAIIAGGPDRTFAASECGFYLTETDDAAIAERAFPMAAADFASVNPNTGTAPIFRSRRDAELTTAIYGRVPVLVDHRTDPPAVHWPVRYVRMFDMTNDSGLFRTRAELEGEGFYPVAGNRLQKGPVEYVPLYVGRMFHQFDHRAASVSVNEENIHNAANSETVSAAQKADPTFAPSPQFFVDWAKVYPQRMWNLAFRDIARATDARTVIASILPGAAYNNKAPLLGLSNADDAALVCANLNSTVLDYVARSKIQATSANWFIVEQLPILPPAVYDRPIGTITAAELVRREVLRLTYTAHDMAAFARDLGHDGQPFAWDENDRRHRRARLDALFFILYGIGREDADYILSTFPIVEREDRAAHGRYLTRDLILAYMNALAAGDVDSIIALPPVT